MEKEQWKKIEGIDGDYIISNLGNIINTSTGRNIGFIGSDNYVHFICKINGKPKNIRVHQLVYDAFGTDRWDGKNVVIDHINNIKHDNRISNLQAIKFRDNCKKEINPNMSGIVGISWNNQKKRWLAQISIENVRYKLGFRRTIEDAKSIYDKALRCYEEFGITPKQMKYQVL